MSEYHEGISEDRYATPGEGATEDSLVEAKWLVKMRNIAIGIGVVALGMVFEGSDKLVLAESAGAAFTVAAIAEALRR